MDLQISFSTFSELEVENKQILTGLFLNIVDGIIIDGTINKSKINSEKTWSYINKIINFEKVRECATI